MGWAVWGGEEVWSTELSERRNLTKPVVRVFNRLVGVGRVGLGSEEVWKTELSE